MSKYFILQCKRILRYLPGVLIIIAFLLGGLLTVPRLLAQQDANSNHNEKVSVALCGDLQDDFLQMALSAITTLDSSRYTLNILQMDEARAAKALSSREVAAYVVFPQGFMDLAMAGELIPLKMVSTTGASDVVSVFKEELTKALGDLLASSEKGVFALDNVIRDEELSGGGHLDRLALRYVDHIIARDRIYRVVELGIGQGLSLTQYLACGLGVVFLLLCCLAFAPLHIQKDPALSRLLRAKGHGAAAQTLCDLSAFILTLLVIAGLVLPLIALTEFASLSPGKILMGIPVILMAAAYSFLLFSLADNLMTGVLMQFFVSLALCFVSGCIYPVYFFPVGVQKAAALLPTGLARTQLTGDAGATLGLLGYTLLFTVLSIWVRSRKIRGVEG